MNKTIIWLIIILVVVIGGYFLLNKPVPTSGEVIKIGALVPLTGDLAVLGERIRNGMELAKEDLLKENPDRSIEIIYEDVCLPKDAVSAAQKLIKVDKVSIIGGSFCLIGLVPVLPITEENKIIVFNTAANPDSVLNKKYVFSTNVSIKSDAEKIAEKAKNLDARTAAIVYLDTPFGHDYNKYLIENFTRLGGRVLISETKLRDARDFRTELAKIKSTDPDVVFVIHYGSSLGAFLKQARELGIKSKIIGHYEAEDPTVIEFAGSATDGFIISSSEPANKTAEIKKFEEKYKERFGELPDVLAANAYDALMFQIAAHEECAGDPDCMNTELHKIKNYGGVSGQISINEDGSTSKPTIFKIVKNGQFVRVED